MRKIFAILIIIVIVVAAWCFMGGKRTDSGNVTPINTTKSVTVQMGDKALSLTIPTSWYAHPMDDNATLFTRDEVLPNVGDTEMYAYGEQIYLHFGELLLDATPEKWVEDRPYILDEEYVTNSEWTEVVRQTVLKVQSTSAVTSEEVMTYYLFADGRVYELYLYPLTSENLGTMNSLLLNIAEQI